MRRLISRMTTAVAAATLALGAGLAAAQEDLAGFYEGNTVTILIGHPPGGSYDLYAQLTARHLGDHIPGNPEVIVQHMPGGGGSLAAAHFANRAPDDGTMLAIIPEGLAAKQLMEPDTSHWDLNEMRYVGRLNDVRSVMMMRKGAAAGGLDGIYETETPVGCTGTTSGSSQTGAVFRYFTDVKFRMVCGYDGSSAVILALIRGEVDATSSVWTTWVQNQQEEMDAGNIFPIIQFGLTPIDAIADVPLAIDLIEDPAAKSAMRFFAASGEVGRSLLSPPGMSDEKYEMFVEAFDAMVEDPEFKADVEENGIPLTIMHAAELEEIKAGILATPDADVQLLATAMEKGFE